MDKLLKTRWVKALRSGKYKKTTGYMMKSGVGFCCLGVLCDIQKVNWEETLRLNTSNIDSAFPNKKLSGGLDDQQQECLANLNDSGHEFDYIADFIERHY